VTENSDGTVAASDYESLTLEQVGEAVQNDIRVCDTFNDSRDDLIDTCSDIMKITVSNTMMRNMSEVWCIRKFRRMV